MLRPVPLFHRLAPLCLAALLAALFALPLLAQEGDLTAKRRMFPEVGPGLRAVRHGQDGRYYILQSPAPGVIVYSPDEKPVLQIGAGLAANPATKARPVNIVFGEDCDVNSAGRIYVADRGANAVLVFSPDGSLLQTIRVNAPVSVAALPDSEVAVVTLTQPHLVVVYDKNGREAREFGNPEDLSDRADLNRFLNIGRIKSDPSGHIYYGFDYFPEATVRPFDRFGYTAGPDIQYTNPDAFPEARAVRKEIEKQEKRGGAPAFKRVLTAVCVDPDTGEGWMALHQFLLHFDKEGSRRATYSLYTPTDARLEANTIVVEKNRLIIGSDPLGVYEFARPALSTGVGDIQ